MLSRIWADHKAVINKEYVKHLVEKSNFSHPRQIIDYLTHNSSAQTVKVNAKITKLNRKKEKIRST